MLTVVLLVINLIFLVGAGLFTYESLREKEPRAPKFGVAGVLFHLGLAALILAVPPSRPVLAVFFGVLLFNFSPFPDSGKIQSPGLERGGGVYGWAGEPV